MSFSKLIASCEKLAPAIEKVGQATRKASENLTEYVRYSHEMTARQAKLIDDIESRGSAFLHVNGKQFMSGIMNLIGLLDEAKRKGEVMIQMKIFDQILATNREMQKLLGLGLSPSDIFGFIRETGNNRRKRMKAPGTNASAPPGTMP